jgi:glycerophosphoryl diester phosphodiesterase
MVNHNWGNDKRVSKLGISLLVFATVLLSLFAVPDIEAVVDQPIIIGAHRGNSISDVENTGPALRQAVDDNKYKFIEFDVQYTKDKKIVIFHDLSLFRFQKQMFKVKDLTYDELNKLSRYHVPIYEDVMDMIGNTKKFNIEIKSQGNLADDKMLVDYVIADCQSRGIMGNILLSSISEDVLKYIASEYPELDTGQIFFTMWSTYFHVDAWTQELYEKVANTGADYVNLRNYESLSRLKPENITLVFWNFDDKMYVVNGMW